MIHLKKTVFVVLLIITFGFLEYAAHSSSIVHPPVRRLLWLIVCAYLCFVIRAGARLQATNAIVWGCPALVLGTMLVNGAEIPEWIAAMFTSFLVVPWSWQFTVPLLVPACSSIAASSAIVLELSPPHDVVWQQFLEYGIVLSLVIIAVWWFVNYDDIYDHTRRLKPF